VNSLSRASQRSCSRRGSSWLVSGGDACAWLLNARNVRTAGHFGRGRNRLGILPVRPSSGCGGRADDGWGPVGAPAATKPWFAPANGYAALGFEPCGPAHLMRVRNAPRHPTCVSQLRRVQKDARVPEDAGGAGMRRQIEHVPVEVELASVTTCGTSACGTSTLASDIGLGGERHAFQNQMAFVPRIQPREHLPKQWKIF
jgi:hypothetical protein